MCAISFKDGHTRDKFGHLLMQKGTIVYMHACVVDSSNIICLYCTLVHACINSVSHLIPQVCS